MRRLLSIMLCALILGLATGCSTMSTNPTAASQPTASPAPTTTKVPGPPTPTNVPQGWQVYSSQHFTVAYPAGWTMTESPAQTGLMGGGIILDAPAGASTGQVSLTEEWGYSTAQLQAMCHLQSAVVTLDGLSMQYSVGEGVHRNWLFINSHGVAYSLDAMDASQPQSVQQQDDSILATFRPDDAATGCA